MARFSYGTPESGRSAPGWNDLSSEALTALTPQRAEHDVAGLLLGETLPFAQPSELEARAEAWARAELEGAEREDAEGKPGVLQKWYPFRDPDLVVPSTLEELDAVHNNLMPTLARLYAARMALARSGETAPPGINVADTMHLVVLPWKKFLDCTADGITGYGESLLDWMRHARYVQKDALPEALDPRLVNAINKSDPIYRDEHNPAQLLSLTEYLVAKVAKDGPWGVILAQTTGRAGLESTINSPSHRRSPDVLTDQGKRHFEVAGHAVDGMGILEWFGVTIQEADPRVSMHSSSWLLGNRIRTEEFPQGLVPVTSADGRVTGQAEIKLSYPATNLVGARIRLAVV